MNSTKKALALCAIVTGFSFAGGITGTHQTTKWQSIGSETIATTGSSNNGVSWYDGTNWVGLTSGAIFSVGQTVDFKVEIFKEFQGTHISDVARVWIDNVIKGEGEFALASNGFKKNGLPYFDGNVIDGTQNVLDGTPSTYIPQKVGDILFQFTFSQVKNYELVARVMCSDDLSQLNGNSNWTSTQIKYVKSDNTYGLKNQRQPETADWNLFTASTPSSTLQGEIEKYTITVQNSVPEPASMLLLGFGLLSLAFVGRKSRK